MCVYVCVCVCGVFVYVLYRDENVNQHDMIKTVLPSVNLNTAEYVNVFHEAQIIVQSNMKQWLKVPTK